MTRSFDVLLLGGYFCDLIFTGLPRLPRLGEEVYSTGFEMMAGGSFISAVALRRLGVKVGWAADFGNDLFSRFALEMAQAERLDASLFGHHDRPLRRVSATVSFPHERAFISFADAAPEASARFRALETASARVIFLPSLTLGPLLDAALANARSNGAKVVMDCQSTKETSANPAVRRAIGAVDVFMPNAAEAQQLTGAADRQTAICQLAELCAAVVVKDGGDGAYGAVDGRILHAPALDVRAIDPTGAGDCFDAGFIRAMLDDRPIYECLRWGNVCGGLSTTAVGGATAAPTLEKVIKYFSDQ